MRIESCNAGHLDAWARLRSELWPWSSADGHRKELTKILTEGKAVAAFVAQTDDGEIVGFAEAALRHDPVNGCETSPVVFLEGVYVSPAHRRYGIATALAAAVESWGRSLGCTEFGSDAMLDNAESQAFHASIGFEEREKVRFFRKHL